jgi:hypothetical protein
MSFEAILDNLAICGLDGRQSLHKERKFMPFLSIELVCCLNSFFDVTHGPWEDY